MLIASVALFSAAMFVLGLVSRDHHVDRCVPRTTCMKAASALRVCCYRLFLQHGGMIFPMVAAVLLAREKHPEVVLRSMPASARSTWRSLFSPSAVIPGAGQESANHRRARYEEKWGIGVLFPSVAALCCITGQLGFISGTRYAKGLGMSLNDAGKLVSDFWMSYMLFGVLWAFSFIPPLLRPCQRILTQIAGRAGGQC